jgi:hypothetical protein
VRPIFDRPSLRYFLFLTSLFLVFSVLRAHPATSETLSLDDVVRQLAERVAAIPNLRSPLHLEFIQDPAVAIDTGKNWQEVFRKEMERHHLALTDDQAAPLLRVGLAVTPTQLVLSADTRVAERDAVRIVTLPRSSFQTASLPIAPIRIERQLLYQGPDRILDASSLWNGAEGGMALLAVHNAELSILRLDAAGEVNQSIALDAADAHPSRDPRAELTVRAADSVVLLPSKSCEFNWAAPAEVKCRAVKPTWRGSTVLTPSCDTGGWKLLADGSDWSTPDVLQVVPDGSQREGSAALLSDFPGPILSINGELNRASALVVTRNLRTGNYEVYKITLVCGS